VYWHSRRPTWAWCGMAAVTISACGFPEAEVQKHAQKVASLRATTLSITEAWVQGDVTGTYAEVALAQTFQLVEQERAAVAATPADLARPQSNALARDTEAMSRVIAALSRDVQSGDGANARRHLENLPVATPEQP
jgi:hypothetical protein